MKALTVFTWGYWGWGSLGREFMKRARRLERARGHRSPLFVDIRYSREVHARDFSGHAFEKICGASGYIWMPELGNENIATGKPGLKLCDPGAAKDLFDIIVRAHKSGRRVIVFCACEYSPKGCHRFAVAKLLKKEARKRGLKLSTVEWPGGTPTIRRIEVEKKVIDHVLRNATRVSLPLPLKDIDRYFSLPWFSRILLTSPEKQIAVVAGPAKAELAKAKIAKTAGTKNAKAKPRNERVDQRGIGRAMPRWYLPILGPEKRKANDTVRSLAGEVERLRRLYPGQEP